MLARVGVWYCSDGYGCLKHHGVGLWFFHVTRHTSQCSIHNNCPRALSALSHRILDGRPFLKLRYLSDFNEAYTNIFSDAGIVCFLGVVAF